MYSVGDIPVLALKKRLNEACSLTSGSSERGLLMMQSGSGTINETTGITTTNFTDSENNAPVYNLAGQRVNNSAKGIVIKDGKKIIK